METTFDAVKVEMRLGLKFGVKLGVNKLGVKFGVSSLRSAKIKHAR